MTNVYLQELPPITLGGSSLHYDIKNYSFTGEKLTTLIMLIPPLHTESIEHVSRVPL